MSRRFASPNFPSSISFVKKATARISRISEELKLISSTRFAWARRLIGTPQKAFPKFSRKFGPTSPQPKRINLALQGGSAHGAFTWGVLDRLLEEPRIEVEGVSATSAGAMNAVVMAHGLTTGGRKGAREALEEFWNAVARPAFFLPHPPTAAALRALRLHNYGLELDAIYSRGQSATKWAGIN
jgi:Patatin-like phospholipase